MGSQLEPLKRRNAGVYWTPSLYRWLEAVARIIGEEV
jgi:hypothetical protein